MSRWGTFDTCHDRVFTLARRILGFGSLGLVVGLVLGGLVLASCGGSNTSGEAPTTRTGSAAVLDQRAGGQASVVATADGILVAISYGIGDQPTCPAGPVGLVDESGRLGWRAEPPAQLFTVAGRASDSNVVADGVGTDCRPGPFVSTDAGVGWQPRSRPDGFTLPMPWLALDPGGNRVLAWTAGRVFETADLGATWTSRPSSARPLAIAPDGRLFGWWARGIVTSTDGGGRWSPYSLDAGAAIGQPRAAVTWGDGVVTAGTDGLVRVDPAGDRLVLDEGDALAVATGGRPGSEFLVAVVVAPDGSTRLVVAAQPDAIAVERIPLPDAALPAKRAVASVAATASQIVLALGDGQTVVLVRVPVIR